VLAAKASLEHAQGLGVLERELVPGQTMAAQRLGHREPVRLRRDKRDRAPSGISHASDRGEADRRKTKGLIEDEQETADNAARELVDDHIAERAQPRPMRRREGQRKRKKAGLVERLDRGALDELHPRDEPKQKRPRTRKPADEQDPEATHVDEQRDGDEAG